MERFLTVMMKWRLDGGRWSHFGSRAQSRCKSDEHMRLTGENVTCIFCHYTCTSEIC